MLKGERVLLRAIEPADLPQLMEWRNLPEFRKHFREYREINSDMQRKWFENTVINDKNTLMFSICDVQTAELIGCCGLCNIDWIHRNGELSFYIGRNREYVDDTGYAEETCRLLFCYGFGELGFHKIWAEIYEFDEKKIALFRKLGMKRDGVLRDQYFYDYRWWDSYVFSLLSE